MDDEISALHSTNTWTLVSAPSNANIIANKWIYRIKRKPDGTINKFKARLVAKGFTQRAGIDYKKIFSLVVKATIIRIVLALAAMHK